MLDDLVGQFRAPAEEARDDAEPRAGADRTMVEPVGLVDAGVLTPASRRSR